jgi:hypothetical protein
VENDGSYPAIDRRPGVKLSFRPTGKRALESRRGIRRRLLVEMVLCGFSPGLISGAPVSALGGQELEPHALGDGALKNPCTKCANHPVPFMRGQEVSARAAPNARESGATIVRPSGRITRRAPFKVNRDSSEMVNFLRVIIEAESPIV